MDGLIWCFRLHSWFFIRTQDQHTTYQFSELLLTTWVKLAKQVQMFLKFHLQHIFLIYNSMTPKAFLNVAKNTAKITFLINIHFPRNCSSRTTLYQLPEHTDSNFHFKSELNLQDELIF